MGKKGDKTFENILDAALKSFSKFGDRGTTFQTIANLAGVSQPLVSKYFKSREAVLPAVLEKYLGEVRQQTTLEIEKSKSATEQLKTYISFSISFYRKNPDIFKIYLLMHYQAGFNKVFLELNTQRKQFATERIKKIIDKGIENKEFVSCRSDLVAKVIHSSLVGLIISMTTEKLNHSDAQLLKMMTSMTLDWLQVPGVRHR
jgi:AcrR family transcriptional regulator